MQHFGRNWLHFTALFLFTFISAGAAFAQAPQSTFDRWDKNGDGKLTREEVPQSHQGNFDRVDRDGDGFVSREEDAAIRGINPGKPKGIKVVDNVDYAGTRNPRQTLDLFVPEKPATDGPLPVVVFIHGGAWQSGSKEDGLRQLRNFLSTRKFAGASIAYRLTDEASWPSQIHDCKAAIRWIRAHAEEYGLDSKRIAARGDSAGGHLVAMLGVSHGVEDLEGTIGAHTDQDSGIQAVVDFFGPTELLTMGEGEGDDWHNAPNSAESKLVGGPVLEMVEAAKSASPIEHVTADDAPFLIIHGDADPTVPYAQSVKFEKKLEAAGVPAIFITVKGGGHGKGFGPGIDRIVEDFITRELLGEERELKDGTVDAVSFAARKPQAPAKQPATVRRTLRSGDRERSYHLYIPTSLDREQAVPLLFCFHGAGGTGLASMGAFRRLADEHGFLLVGPDGINRRWNVGGQGEIDATNDADDVTFVSDMVTTLKSEFKIDSSRVYSYGFSNGAALQHRLAAEIPETFAAMSAAGASMALNTAEGLKPGPPVSMQILVGGEDSMFGHKGNLRGNTFHTCTEAARIWSKYNQCGEAENLEKPVRFIRWPAPEGSKVGEVELWIVEGGGHTSNLSPAFNTPQESWKFLSRQRRQTESD